MRCGPCIRESLFGSWQQPSLREELDMRGLVTFGSADSVSDSFWLVCYPGFWLVLVTGWHCIVTNGLCRQSLCRCPLHIQPPVFFNTNLSILAPFSRPLIGEIQWAPFQMQIGSVSLSSLEGELALVPFSVKRFLMIMHFNLVLDWLRRTFFSLQCVRKCSFLNECWKTKSRKKS